MNKIGREHIFEHWKLSFLQFALIENFRPTSPPPKDGFGFISNFMIFFNCFRTMRENFLQMGSNLCILGRWKDSLSVSSQVSHDPRSSLLHRRPHVQQPLPAQKGVLREEVEHASSSHRRMRWVWLKLDDNFKFSTSARFRSMSGTCGRRALSNKTE